MATGQLTTYDLEVGVLVDIEPMIHQLSPHETPLLGAYGADGRSALARGTCFEKKVEWLDEVLLVPRSTAAASALVGATTVTIPAADAFKFQVGDVIRIAAELVRVTAIDTNGTSLTITRAFGGTTAAAIASGAPLVGVGLVLAEGSDPGDGKAVDRVNRYNVTQIFGPYKVQTSATENVVRKYGLPNGNGTGSGEFGYQVGQRLKEIAVAREQAILYGVRYEDTSSEMRTMGGMVNYITTNVDSSTTTLTEEKLLDLQQDVYDAGGAPDRVTLSPYQKRIVSAFDSSAIQLTRGDNGRGQIVDSFNSDFGMVSFLPNRWVRNSDLFLYSREQAEFLTLRSLQFEMLAKTGDSIKGQIVGENTFKFTKDRHAGRFSALT